MADPISFLDARLRRLEVLRLQALRRADVMTAIGITREKAVLAGLLPREVPAV
jgi:hypothetical protein